MSANPCYWLGTLVGTLVGGLVSLIVVLASAYWQGIATHFVVVCPSAEPNHVACGMLFIIGVGFATVFLVILAFVGCIEGISWACTARNRQPEAVAGAPVVATSKR